MIERITNNKLYLSKQKQVELADKARDGDDNAWSMLYASFFDAMLGFIAGRIGNLNDAKDLCQDTFIRAQINLRAGKYDPRYSFYLFLRNIASFIIKKYWNELSRKEMPLEPPFESNKNPGGTQEMADPRETQDYTLERLEMLKLVIISCAKPHQILAVEFVKLLQWKPKEVVRELGDDNLGFLSRKFFDSYAEVFNGLIRKKIIYEYGTDQFIKIGKNTKEIYTETEYHEKLKDYYNTKVRELLLQLFFTKKGEVSLHDWCNKVKNKVKHSLQEGMFCDEFI